MCAWINTTGDGGIIRLRFRVCSNLSSMHGILGSQAPGIWTVIERTNDDGFGCVLRGLASCLCHTFVP